MCRAVDWRVLREIIFDGYLRYRRLSFRAQQCSDASDESGSPWSVGHGDVERDGLKKRREVFASDGADSPQQDRYSVA